MTVTAHKQVFLRLMCAGAMLSSVAHAAENPSMWPFKFFKTPPVIQSPIQRANLFNNNIQVLEKKTTLLSNTEENCVFESSEGMWLYQKNETKNNESWTLNSGQPQMITWDLPHLDIYSIWAPLDCTKIQFFDISIKNRKYALWQGVGVDIWQEGPAQDWRFGHLLPYDQEHKGLPISNRYTIHDTIGLTSDGALAFAKLKPLSSNKEADASPEWLVSPKVMDDISIIVSNNTPLFKTITYRVKSENRIHQVQIDFNTNVLKKWDSVQTDFNKDSTPTATSVLPNDTRYELMRVHQFLWNDLINTGAPLNAFGTPTITPSTNANNGSKPLFQSSILFTTVSQQREMNIDLNNQKVLNIMSMLEKLFESSRFNKPTDSVVTPPKFQVKVL